MPLTDEQYRAGAIAFINRKTGLLFYDVKEGLPETIPEGVTPQPIPPDLEIAVDILATGAKQNPAIASQSLGDMSKSFFDNSTHEKAAMKYIKPYMKAKFF